MTHRLRGLAALVFAAALDKAEYFCYNLSVDYAAAYAGRLLNQPATQLNLRLVELQNKLVYNMVIK